MKSSWRRDLLIAGCSLFVCTTVQAVSIERIDYKRWEAYRLSDGRSEAIVVPAIGRVVSYNLCGSANRLWSADLNADHAKTSGNAYVNWGGQQTWLAPQELWKTLLGHIWPPDPAWGAVPQVAEITAEHRLRLTGSTSKAFGIRIVHEFFFSDNGDFVIRQEAEKLEGPPVRVALWSDCQSVAADAIYLPLNPDSAYPEKFHWLLGSPAATPRFTRLSGSLLRVQPSPPGSANYKIGMDAPIASIVSVKDGVAMRQCTQSPSEGAKYPDGVGDAGFPVEFYFGGNREAYQCELELLGPLEDFAVGTHQSQTVHWSLHPLIHSGRDLDAPETLSEIETLLRDTH